jgi:hypothetical protein
MTYESEDRAESEMAQEERLQRAESAQQTRLYIAAQSEHRAWDQIRTEHGAAHGLLPEPMPYMCPLDQALRHRRPSRGR